MASMNFGKDTADDKYSSFSLEYEEYIKDDLSTDKAQRVATSGWHLTDWIFKNHQTIHKFNELALFRESLYPNCESLKIMHDLATATKHLSVIRPKGDIEDTRKNSGTFDKTFDFTFDTSYLEIEKNDGTKLLFTSEIKKVKEFWDNYFR
jgi:hypothetical protein